MFYVLQKLKEKRNQFNPVLFFCSDDRYKRAVFSNRKRVTSKGSIACSTRKVVVVMLTVPLSI